LKAQPLSRPASISTTVRGDGQWAVVVLLLIVVLLPSATVLWLTSAAVRNERAAVRGQLVGAYQRQLELAAAQINEHWTDVDRRCALLAENATPAELFEACVEAELADAVLILGPSGGLDYPVSGSPVVAEVMNENAWKAAERLEFVDQNFAVAADAYSAIANVEPDVNTEARAWIAHARCLQKNSRVDDAIRVLTEELSRPQFRHAVDRGGRSLWVDAQLRALQLLQKSAVRVNAFAEQRKLLHAALDDYGQAIPSSQRLFAMGEFMRLCPDADRFPMLQAERLAEQHAERLRNGPVSSALARGLADDPNCIALTTLPIVLVFREDTLNQQMQELLAPWHTEDARSEWVSDDSPAASQATIASVPIRSMPGRSLVLTLSNPNFFEDSSRRQTLLYTLAGLITIAVVAVLAAAIALFVRRQLRLAQLKNDLAAVVTHELRTPLASIRLLVDTLLEGSADDPHQRTEYLSLIAQENERLSRLIENFLTFSQLQRNRQRLVLRETPADDLIERAIAATGGKLQQSGCQFSREGCSDLPNICVDPDAIVMVLLNLLDNAVKFTGDEKAIRLTSAAENGFVEFAVSDNGIGMTPAASRRAFERFYQADTRLSRSHGGCGLGLSLVRSIVDAHGGTIEVESAVDEGTTFTVRLPVGGTSESAQQSVSA
jgi:signal transduction histidine kinase